MTTVGADFRIRTIEVEDKKVKLQVWDTAGQERFKTIVSFYYKGADGIIITYDVTNREEFDNIDKVFEEVQSLADENATLILCGNKIDKSDERVISTEEGYSVATKYNVDFIETSAKEGTNISQLFELIAKKIKDKKELDSSF